MLTKAIGFATTAHEGQTRKGSGLPYIVHPLEVMTLLLRHGVRDEVTLVAGVLHDVVEDCNVSSSEIGVRFGRDVEEVVQALTKPSNVADAARKTCALAQLRAGPPPARIVKMADRLSNILDLDVTRWAAPRRLAYLAEADEIAEIGMHDLPALADRLRRVAADRRLDVSPPP